MVAVALPEAASRYLGRYCLSFSHKFDRHLKTHKNCHIS